MNVQVKMTSIQCIRPNEGGDEIYFWLDGNDVRPSGDPDYWLFENEGQKREVDKIVLEGEAGTSCTIDLREQDGGTRFSHDQIGTFTIVVEENTISISPGYATSSLGRDAETRHHIVECQGSDCHYRHEFAAQPLLELI